MNASVTASPGPIEWLGKLRANSDAVGGKAASLDRLARLGFLVPPGFCLTTSAFAAHLSAVADGAPLAAALAALPDEAARTTVVDLVRGTPSPAVICEALRIALAELTAAGETSLAVRSSAIGEDGSAASFAGLHDTELGLSADDVEAAVRRCWSSLWSPAALVYRRRRSLPLQGAAMAVVVQALVPADAAAVVFTRHPVTGRDDQLVINAIRGLGEPMVSGMATPDTVVVDKASGDVVEFSAGDDGERLIATDAGVTRVTDGAGGPALAEPVLRELISLSLEVERAFGAPVDIEAAFARDRWYLLQARPITTHHEGHP
jgi:phosphoenolpyruvate synthase/pyruvate phosphate dikinase